MIRTPDQRLRVFVSSTLQELAEERAAAREAVTKLRLAPVMFELGARPHPPRELYRAYLDQSHIFVGIYWQRYGWVAPGEAISGLEDEYRLSGNRPKLIYIKAPAPEREPRLKELLDRIHDDDTASYKPFSTTAELRELIENDLAVLLTERFEMAQVGEAPLAVEAAESRRNNLPGQLTPFIGREKEIAAVRDLLRRDEVHLVTLSGPGGTGKTRLALQIAAELLDDFADGVFFVPLAPISDPYLVTSTIAQTLDVRESGARPLIETLKDYFRGTQMLLVLDNFEQVVAAAPVVTDLLAVAHRLKVLVTSRELLRLSGEHEYPVPPLALPDRKHLPSLEQLSQVEAVRLFVERAQAVKADFALTDTNAPAVAEVCHRLDGLPLAIELAAARIRLLPPQAILTRLSSRLKLLTGGARDLPTRQQTLRSAIDWSYSLLSMDEQRLFARLGVFVGGCTLEAAEAICNGEGDLDMLEGIASLVDKSLLRQEETNDGEPRFTTLETIREYAVERLEASGEAEAIRQRYAGFFLALAERSAPAIGIWPAEWVHRVDVEYDNLRAVFTWSQADVHRNDTAVRLTVALPWFWYLRSYLSEGREWSERTLAQVEGAGRTRARAQALHSSGVMATFRGEPTTARPRLEESLSIYRELGDQRSLALALFFLGVVALDQGDEATARSAVEEALPLLSQEFGERVSFTFSILGDLALAHGDRVLARAHYERALAAAREANDRWQLAQLLNNLGEVARCEGDDERAVPLYDESLAIFKELNSLGDIARSLHNLGYMALHRGDSGRAAALFAESLALFQERGPRRGVVEALAGLAGVAQARGQPERVARLLGAVGAQFDAIGATMWPADRIEVERDLSAARAQLDETTFQAAWAEGRAMPLGQAIAYALEKSTDA